MRHRAFAQPAELSDALPTLLNRLSLQEQEPLELSYDLRTGPDFGAFMTALSTAIDALVDQNLVAELGGVDSACVASSVGKRTPLAQGC